MNQKETIKCDSITPILLSQKTCAHFFPKITQKFPDRSLDLPESAQLHLRLSKHYPIFHKNNLLQIDMKNWIKTKGN